MCNRVLYVSATTACNKLLDPVLQIVYCLPGQQYSPHTMVDHSAHARLANKYGQSYLTSGKPPGYLRVKRIIPSANQEEKMGTEKKNNEGYYLHGGKPQKNHQHPSCTGQGIVLVHSDSFVQ